MKIFFVIILGLFTFLFFGGVSNVFANLSYGSGYYTNLCDSGTAASYYNCDPGCNPTLGSCQSANSGVVKWTCSGKWDQCLASETGWDGYEDFSGVACGTTVQLSLFDKKCRREDGTFDNSCRLLGYMVWYSGDCTPGFLKTPIPTQFVTPTQKTQGVLVPTATVTPLPTLKPSPTVKITSTPVPTPLPTSVSKLGSIIKNTATPTKSVIGNICGKTCNNSNLCQAGFVCSSGICRNPACVDDKSCFCGQVQGAVAAKSPATAESSWWGALILCGVGFLGLKMRKMAKKVW